jgi:plastocyanin
MTVTTRSSRAGRWLRLMAAAALALAALEGRARAQGSDPADAEEMRREIRSLKAQLQALKAAMGEAAEFDRMRASALSRALGTPTGSSDTAAPPAPTAPAVKEKISDPPRRSRSAAPALRRAQASESSSSTGSLRGRVDVPAGEPVAYVYIENIHGPSVRNEVKKIEHINKQFVPPWAVVQRGTTLQFPNLDNIYHNVFSLSSGNTFDLGLYNSSGDAKGHTFDEAGAVDIYCNIHPQMAASVLVVPNRFFSRVKADGSFEIGGVPSGRRKVVAWAPGSRLAADWVEVPAGASTDIALKLEPKASGHKNKAGRPYGSYE